MTADFNAAFAALRQILLDHAEGLKVTVDEPTSVVVRTLVEDAKGEAGWFGMVAIKKSYVAFHLTAMYFHPDLAGDLSPDLTRRRQGKTCFNFRSVEPTLFDELSDLVARTRKALDQS